VKNEDFDGTALNRFVFVGAVRVRKTGETTEQTNTANDDSKTRHKLTTNGLLGQ